MVCRRLLGPLDRAVIMAGLEAGLSHHYWELLGRD